MSHTVLVIRTYLKLGFLNMLQYRVNFLFEVIGVTTHLITAFLGLAVVFNQTDSLNGWSAFEIVILVGIQTTIGGLLGTVIEPSFQAFMEHVRQGTLDFTLVKPADAQTIVSLQRIEGGAIAGIIAGVATMAIGIREQAGAIGLGEAMLFLMTLASGVVIVYCFLLILTTFAFWFVKLDNILVIFGTSFGTAGSWPITIYPGWLRASLTFIVPVAFAVTIPAQSLTGRLSAGWAIGAVAAAVGFVVASRLFWRFGLRHYTGASA
jgi:ABC-2 type transport system permease protein